MRDEDARVDIQWLQRDWREMHLSLKRVQDDLAALRDFLNLEVVTLPSLRSVQQKRKKA